jgi:FkbM family methyltransferase
MKTFFCKKNDVVLTLNDDDKDQNLPFWKNIFSSWERETFQVFDQMLHPEKTFIDIGAWIGTTCIYGSKKSKHVFAIEADTRSFADLSKNINLNSKNITPVNRAIFNVDDQIIHFGKNKFMQNSKLNDSTSQIYTTKDNLHDTYPVKTITISGLIKMYDIRVEDISLIKVDIEGGEENILDDLYSLHKIHSVPLYISFHYSWWSDKNLDRFTFLKSQQKAQIYKNPFVSLLFKNSDVQ